ncbi:MAG: PQQ-dependent sugar dehydrogenase [Balneolaceae bacterium]
MKLLYYCLSAIFLSILMLSCGEESITVSDDQNDQPTPIVESISVPDDFSVTEFADDITLPTSLEFSPDGSGRLFVNELQSGKIWVYENGEKHDEPFADLSLNIGGGFPYSGENGLIGLEFDPDYEDNGYVYISYASRENGEEVGTVARYTDVNGKGEDFTVLLSGLPSDKGHQIENVRIGPDGYLYVSVGDAYEDQKAQDADEFHGKILRMTREGEIPDDNPFGSESYIYAIGFRNAFDMIFRDDGELLVSDNGPTGMDRLMSVQAGGNYGWPAEPGFHDNSDFINPAHVWTETVSPTGMLFYEGDQFPTEFRGKLFHVLFGYTYSEGPNSNGKRVQVLDLSGEGEDLSIDFNDFAVWEFDEEFPNNPVDIAEGPDGSLYVSDIFQGKIYKISYEE